MPGKPWVGRSGHVYMSRNRRDGYVLPPRTAAMRRNRQPRSVTEAAWAAELSLSKKPVTDKQYYEAVRQLHRRKSVRTVARTYRFWVKQGRRRKRG